MDTLLFEATGRPYQWNLKNTGGTINGISCESGVDIGIEDAWAIQESVSVKVGVADSGIDGDHVDLEDNIDDGRGRTFIPTALGFPPGFTFSDSSGHGTSVAGIIGAIHSTDSLGVAGVAGLPTTSLTDGIIVPLKVLSNQPQTVVPNQHEAIAYVNALGYVDDEWPDIPIINSSLSLWTTFESDTTEKYISDYRADLIRDAIKNTFLTGVFHAVSAGNGKPPDGRAGYPFTLRHLVTAATSVGCDESRPENFRSGSHVDLAAPASASNGSTGSVLQIVTTEKNDKFKGIDGEILFGATSAASPHVAGVAALLLSHSPLLTNEDVREVLQRTATEETGGVGYDVDYGHGILNAGAALEALDSYTLVHAGSNTVDTSSIVDSCVQIAFRNVSYTTGLTVGLIGNQPDTVYADVYEFETDVSLADNTNAAHDPEVWVRGIGSASARRVNVQSSIPTYDGNFENYYAEVVSSDDDSALLRGYTYKLYKDVATPCDSLFGWFPLKLPKTGPADVFAYTYLADDSTSVSGSGDPRGGISLLITPSSLAADIPLAVGTEGVDVFDVAGRLVDSWRIDRGRNQDVFRWMGTSLSGRQVPSGVYFAVSRQGSSEADVARITVVR